VNSTDPVGYVVWYREQRRGAKWKKVAATTTHAEAAARMSGRGSWWVNSIYDPELFEAECNALRAKNSAAVPQHA